MRCHWKRNWMACDSAFLCWSENLAGNLLTRWEIALFALRTRKRRRQNFPFVLSRSLAGTVNPLWIERQLYAHVQSSSAIKMFQALSTIAHVSSSSTSGVHTSRCNNVIFWLNQVQCCESSIVVCFISTSHSTFEMNTAGSNGYINLLGTLKCFFLCGKSSTWSNLLRLS